MVAAHLVLFILVKDLVLTPVAVILVILNKGVLLLLLYILVGLGHVLVVVFVALVVLLNVLLDHFTLVHQFLLVQPLPLLYSPKIFKDDE